MNAMSIVDQQHDALADLCRRHGVRRLEVFGSAVRDDFDPGESDFDFLVELEERSRTLDTYLRLEEDLRALFGRRVDLVMPGAIRNPYLRAAIERDRQLLYAA